MIKSMVLVNDDIVKPQKNVVQVQGLQTKLIIVKQGLEPIQSSWAKYGCPS
jgi:hypothetical protein